MLNFHSPTNPDPKLLNILYVELCANKNEVEVKNEKQKQVSHTKRYSFNEYI